VASFYEFGLSFTLDNCQLNHASFYQMKIKKTIFKNSQLQEVDFAPADLPHAVFENCNLAQASLDHTILEKTDFRTAYYYSIDPEINRIKKAKFSVLGLSGLLDKLSKDAPHKVKFLTLPLKKDCSIISLVLSKPAK
jgi:uncharacterized protein YjbI with pentapeptide repeats